MTPHRQVLWLLLFLSVPVAGQARASEPAGVTQVLDGARFTLEYSRPRSRARDSLFGRVVKWGETWTPGADWATTLDAGRDFTLDGHPVPKGKYSVWMVVQPGGEWTLILDPRHHRFHENRPDSTAEQFRFPLRTTQAPYADALLWWWPELRPLGGTLAMQWGTTRVSMAIAVESRYRMQVSREEAAPYVGRYSFRELKTPDTATAEPFLVRYVDGSLWGQWTVGDTMSFLMVPIRQDWFIPRWHYPGEGPDVYDVDPTLLFEFTRQGECAVSFVMRETSDSVVAVARREGDR